MAAPPFPRCSRRRFPSPGWTRGAQADLTQADSRGLGATRLALALGQAVEAERRSDLVPVEPQLCPLGTLPTRPICAAFPGGEAQNATNRARLRACLSLMGQRLQEDGDAGMP